MAEQLPRSQTVIPPPPRSTGDPATDSKASIDWIWQFFQTSVVQSGLLDPSVQATAETIDPNNLPDPGNTTIATAQATANAAMNVAQSAVTALKNHSLFP